MAGCLAASYWQMRMAASFMRNWKAFAFGGVGASGKGGVIWKEKV